MRQVRTHIIISNVCREWEEGRGRTYILAWHAVNLMEMSAAALAQLRHEHEIAVAQLQNLERQGEPPPHGLVPLDAEPDLVLPDGAGQVGGQARGKQGGALAAAVAAARVKDPSLPHGLVPLAKVVSAEPSVLLAQSHMLCHCWTIDCRIVGAARPGAAGCRAGSGAARCCRTGG